MGWVFLNNRLVPLKRASVSIFDRSFLYGDGLFETLRLVRGQPWLWDLHWRRLNRGAQQLRIQMPVSEAQVLRRIRTLVKKNRVPEALMRLQLSRGVGVRGYSPEGAKKPLLVMSMHPLPKLARARPMRWKVIASPFRVSSDCLGNCKHSSRLLNVMARALAEEANAQEALLMDAKGNVIEGCATNVFWIKNGRIFTPGLKDAGLPGITRFKIMELAGKMGWKVREKKAPLALLKKADAVFLTLTPFGIIEVSQLDGQRYARNSLITRLWRALEEARENVAQWGRACPPQKPSK